MPVFIKFYDSKCSSLNYLSLIKYLKTNNDKISEIINLQIHGCKISSISPEICRLRSLKKLLLGKNSISSLPAEIDNLTKLIKLSLSDNKLTSLPVNVCNITSLTDLMLDYNKLTSLPAEISQLKSLTRLHLSQNHLTSLPAEIGQLSSLEELSLGHNNLTSLPSEIGQLSSLNYLSLNNNRIKSLPTETANLTLLTFLTISGNQLTSFPAEIMNIVSLEKLFIDHNKLTSIPTEISQLTKLAWIDLQYNQLTSLPIEIGYLDKLHTLSLTDNQLTSLPISFTNLTRMAFFDCDANLHNQRDAILDELKTKRSHKASLELCPRLKFWIAYREPSYMSPYPILNKYSDNFDPGSFETLSNEHKVLLYEYLTRLQSVKDFQHSPNKLANHLFDFLGLAQISPEFSNVFYTELEENNTCCQDRTAMSTNIIYTYYILFSLNLPTIAKDNDESFENTDDESFENTDDESFETLTITKNTQLELTKSTIELFISLAKTFTLRSLIQKYLIKHPSLESVEIYLYYESNLNKTLKLTTIMGSMHYPYIGNKETNLTFEYLTDEVNHTYINYLLNSELFMNLLKTNKKYETQFDNIIDNAYSQLELNPDNSKQIMDDKISKEKQLINDIIIELFE